MSNKKTALITGASQGIGFETARQLAQIGITVLIGAREVKEGMEAADKLKSENFDAHFITRSELAEKAIEFGDWIVFAVDVRAHVLLG